MLVSHFAVDRIQALLATEDPGLDVGLGQLPAHTVQNSPQQLAAVPARCLDRFGQGVETPGMDVLEGQILQLPGDIVESQTRGDWYVDFQCFVGNPPALLRPDRPHCLQVMAAVGELDQHDAQIARHRHQHLAKVFRLGILIGLKLDLVQLGQPVDQIGHLLAEFLGNLGLADRRVFHDIVQQRRDDGRCIHAPLSHRAGHG